MQDIKTENSNSGLTNLFTNLSQVVHPLAVLGPVKSSEASAMNVLYVNDNVIHVSE